jgi:hypothetical protein
LTKKKKNRIPNWKLIIYGGVVNSIKSLFYIIITISVLGFFWIIAFNNEGQKEDKQNKNNEIDNFHPFLDFFKKIFYKEIAIIRFKYCLCFPLIVGFFLPRLISISYLYCYMCEYEIKIGKEGFSRDFLTYWMKNVYSFCKKMILFFVIFYIFIFLYISLYKRF